MLALDAEQAARSPLHGQVIFLVASPESGAELLLETLGCLPGVVAGPVPTHLFSQGVAMLFDRWVSGEFTTRPQGIAELVDEQEFFTAVRLLADRVLEAVRVASTADGQRLVEYSAGHIFQTGVIAAIYPDAHIVHVVRDARQVVTRLASPLRGWPARDAARRWREDQEAVTAAGEFANLHVVRIEDVVADPVAALGELAAILELQPTAADLTEAASVVRGGDYWLSEPLLPYPAAMAEVLVGDLLEAYGYRVGERGRDHRAARFELAVESATGTGRDLLARAIERVRNAAQRAQAETTETSG